MSDAGSNFELEPARKRTSVASLFSSRRATLEIVAVASTDCAVLSTRLQMRWVSVCVCVCACVGISSLGGSALVDAPGIVVRALVRALVWEAAHD
jgi:hypothetical protein